MDELVAGPSGGVHWPDAVFGEQRTQAFHGESGRALITAPITAPRMLSTTSLSEDEIRQICSEDGDTDDEEENRKDARGDTPVYCMYCGDKLLKKNHLRHTQNKHRGQIPLFTLSRNKQRRIKAQVEAKQQQVPIAAEIAIIDQQVKMEKQKRKMINMMKAKKARIAPLYQAQTEAHEIADVGAPFPELGEEANEDVFGEDAAAYIPIKPADENAFRKEMRSVRSIEAFWILTKSFKAHPVAGSVECVPCKTHFSYNFEVAEVDENGKLEGQFGALKHKALDHMFRTKGHERVTNGNNVVQTEANVEAGEIIGRRIYGFALNGTKYKQIKGELFKSKLDKSPIGDINHTEYTLQKMLTSLYECELENVIKQVNAPNPATGTSYITLTADKITLHLKTYHAVGLYYVDVDGIRPVFLKTIETKDRTGQGLANEIVEVAVEMLGISREELSKRLVAVATDGQYISYGVGELVNEMIGRNGKFRTFIWDIAHLIEIAARKSRNQAERQDIRTIEEPWLRHAFCISRALSTFYRQPMQWQRLRDRAGKELLQADVDALEDFNQTLELYEAFFDPLTYKLFSETRWAQYTKDTFKSVIRNYRIMFLDLEDQLGNESRFRADVCNAEFILSITGLMDIYEIVSAMSLNAQRTTAFIWDVIELNEKLMLKLLGLSEKFTSAVTADQELYFHKASLELRNRCQYCSSKIERLNVPITPNDIDCDKDKETFHGGIDAVIEDMAKKLAEYVIRFHAELEEQIRTRVPDVLSWTKDAFSIDAIKARGEREIPESLLHLFNASKEFGIYSNRAISFEEFEIEYLNFADYVKSKTEKRSSLYKNMLFTEEANFCPNLKQLLAASAARSCCEGIIESYGSIMKDRLEHRQRLGLANFNAELFLKINGPEIGEADGLIHTAWNKVFHHKPWHFYRTSRPSRLKDVNISKALDPFQKRKSKFKPLPVLYKF